MQNRKGATRRRTLRLLAVLSTIFSPALMFVGPRTAAAAGPGVAVGTSPDPTPGTETNPVSDALVFDGITVMLSPSVGLIGGTGTYKFSGDCALLVSDVDLVSTNACA